MGKLTISMAMFYVAMLVITRGYAFFWSNGEQWFIANSVTL